MGFTIIGFFNKALELSGAKEIQVYFPTPIEEGKAYSELSLTWS